MDRQIRIVGLALVVLFVALFGQLNNLQLRQASKLRSDPRNTRQIVIDFSRERGRILAADGTVLAASIPVPDQYKRLRQYANGPLWAPVVGHFSFSYGNDGAERAFNDRLSGKKVSVQSLTDLLDARPDTQDVQLTVQPAVQAAAAQALGSRKGAVVAMDVRTGAILAMVGFPTYDPSLLAQHDQKKVQAEWDRLQDDPANPMLPRAYRERYAPGSTFKVVTSAAALTQRPDLAAKSYPVLRELPLKGTTKKLPNFGRESCGGTLPELLRVSCNTGFGQLGLDLGAPALVAQAQQFGFGTRPPFDLPAPATSAFPAVADLKAQPALAFSAIGQLDVSASPLEMCLVSAAVANGGTMMAPHVFARAIDASGREVATAEDKVYRQPMDQRTALQLRAMMAGVVNGGTATKAALPGVQVAAKTGTAQTIGNNAHAWLTSFAPAGPGDHARVAVSVIVESQPGLGDVTGGAIAAPIAKVVLDAALKADPT